MFFTNSPAGVQICYTAAMSDIQFPVSCNKDCGGGCPLIAHVRGGRIVKITDNPERTRYMQGCARGYLAHRVVYSEKRLKAPLIRTGRRGSGDFREAGWDEALDHVAENIQTIKGAYGAQSILQIGTSGACRGAVHHTGRLADRFFSLFGGYTRPTGSHSSGAEQFVIPYVFGTIWAGMDAENLLESRLIILWGANISDTRFGCETEQVIREARKRGAEVIALDPRRSRTVDRLADSWIPLFPGSDTAMMAAVLHVLIEDDLIDRHFLERYTTGFNQLSDYVLGSTDGVPKDPAWAEPLCGVPAGSIVSFARHYAGCTPAALVPGLSVQRTIAGEEAYRMSIALQCATGNLGKTGGSSGSNIWGRMPPPRFPVIGRAPESTGAEIAGVPTYRWADAVLEGTAGGYPADIHCLYVGGGNTLCTGADVHKSVRAFQAVEFSVCHELFMTPTAAYCDVVLPVTGFLEREDVMFPSGNYLLYSAKAAEPPGLARNDYDVYASLAERFGLKEAFTGGLTAGEWLDRFITESEIDDPENFKRTALYIRPDNNRVGFSDFIADPASNRLSTPSGRIELASARYTETGFPAYPTYRGYRPPPERPLYLITPHARYRINSQNANFEWAARREIPVLDMNPQDAARRGIADGDTVHILSDTGSLELPVRVTEAMMPGVVCLLAGAWVEFAGHGAGDDEISGGCPNVLTSTEPTMPSVSSRTHSIGVEVVKAHL